jgi:hypothetical protein
MAEDEEPAFRAALISKKRAFGLLLTALSASSTRPTVAAAITFALFP